MLLDNYFIRHMQGFAWYLSAKYHALLVFIEHRYYGESMPFGSTSYKDASHFQFLTSEQALADFSDVITDIKVLKSNAELELNCTKPQTAFIHYFILQKQLNTTVPAFAIGGSYGGRYYRPTQLGRGHSVLQLSRQQLPHNL